MADAKTKRIVFYGPSGAYEYGEYTFEKDGHSVEVPEDVAEALLETHGENFEEASEEVLAEEKKQAEAREKYEKAVAENQAERDKTAEAEAADRGAFYLGHLSKAVPEEYTESEGSGAKTPQDVVNQPEEKNSPAYTEIRNGEPVTDIDPDNDSESEKDEEE